MTYESKEIDPACGLDKKSRVKFFVKCNKEKTGAPGFLIKDTSVTCEY